MDKSLTYNSIEAERKTLHLVRNGGSVIKQADANDWLPEIRDFVNNMRPKENYIYTLCNALGAGEYWSSNVNGDYFPEKALIKNHNSFVTHGNPYMMHINKDPKKSYGDVLASAYNPRMHRTELIIGYDRARLPSKYIKKIESDENVNLSMGCRVPYDVCSICGNVAPTPSQYCDCIKRYGLNHVYDDGRKLYVINTEPEFFDISIVIVPADKTARILSRIDLEDRPREVIQVTSEKKATKGTEKIASTRTALSADSPNNLCNLVDLLPDVEYNVLEKIAKQTKTAECFIASLRQSKKYMKPHEVQTVLCLQAGEEKTAEYVHSTKRYFEGSNVDATEQQLKLASPIVLELPSRLKDAKQTMVTKIATGDVTPSMSYGIDTLSGEHGLLSQLTAIANLTAVAGMVLNQDVNTWIPMLLTGGNIANIIATQASTPPAAIPPEKDLMLAPLIYAKEASALSLKELYSLPVISAIKKETADTAWEKVASDILTEGVLRLKAKKIIKDSSYP
ncbi:MAG: hypothetical protein DRH24_15655 [Deltaproteobacteria bacterium]|nr:MAG: hypothetical protein DRH24_15655 [Deltaproteobacteria bacterium]